MIWLISSFEIINVLTPDSNMFLEIAASVTDVAAVNPNAMNSLLGNGLSTLSIEGNLAFSNGPKSLPKNTAGCPILCKWVFDNFILADESFAKVVWSFENCLLVNSNFCRKLFSSLE